MSIARVKAKNSSKKKGCGGKDRSDLRVDSRTKQDVCNRMICSDFQSEQCIADYNGC